MKNRKRGGESQRLAIRSENDRPTFGVKFAANGLVRTRPIGELFDILVLTNIEGDDGGKTPTR